uniref:EF-hand domain-containing protein n=1 Tax=Haptolina brevifila TaxID=156173 RepID=A0A7S2N782_9EUKA
MDRSQIAEVAVATLDELSTAGWFLEADPGEMALRTKLRPLFDAADKDGSGSVSVEEVDQMAQKLKIEIKPAELRRLVTEADADGSGELEFEEIVAVLKKQMAGERVKSQAEKEEGRKKKGTSMATLFNVEVVEEDDGGMASMVIHEFIHAIIRMAWECYPVAGTGIGRRLSMLLERALLPGSAHILDGVDPMEEELNSKRVQAVTRYYSEQLLDIFAVFAATDMSLTAQAHMETMSFAELVFLMKQSGLLDGNLSVAKVSEIFAQVNAQATDTGEKDDDAEELSFGEFKNAICRCANAKIPIDLRGDPPEPFEYTWQAFLQVLFLPRMKKVASDMRKGVAKKTL